MNDKPSSSGLLARVADLLSADKPQEALELITKSRLVSLEAKNAKAVCLLRMGKVPQAVSMLCDLLFPGTSVTPSPNAPVVLYTNYVTAMLMQGNVTAATDVLSQVPDREHPAVLRLKDTLRSWRRGLGLGWRVLGVLGLYPDRPVDLSFPPGDIA